MIFGDKNENEKWQSQAERYRVLTATSRSYGKAKNSTSHRIETPNLIEIIFSTVDYGGEATPSAKLHANPFIGGFSANGWNIRPKFLFIYTFFQKLTYRSDPWVDFSARWLKRSTRSHARVCLLGVKKFGINTWPPKNPPKSKFGPKTGQKVKVVTPISSRLNISRTVPDRRLVTIDHL